MKTGLEMKVAGNIQYIQHNPFYFSLDLRRCFFVFFQADELKIGGNGQNSEKKSILMAEKFNKGLFMNDAWEIYKMDIGISVLRKVFKKS